MVCHRCQKMIRVLVLSLYSPVAASTRYRFIQFIPFLKEKGIDLQIRPLLDDVYLHNRFNNKVFPFISVITSIIKRLTILRKQKRCNCTVVDESCVFFANDTESWLGAFRHMRDNPVKRIQMGKYGRERIVEKYSLLCNIPIIEKTVISVCR